MVVDQGIKKDLNQAHEDRRRDHQIEAPLPSISDVLRDHPGHVILDSDEVRLFGVRANPVEPPRSLRPKKLYFLVELPKAPDRGVRRARSGALHVGAKERLEGLMLSRRSVSDLASVAGRSGRRVCFSEGGGGGSGGGAVRLKMRLPKAEVEKVVEASADASEAAERIVRLCMEGGGVNDK
ncbi:Uncharacterized protein QJS10_CPA06g02217 [Acorus calamus]|uniref:Uncharacterized protein n=1 Tax=Acorus calamus TaxID=4465 RepID=A0AAV9ELG6_ACOCL|nr:Uncharacterized protein QJS10_CPA06g02217 [Acorus calamus]